jgi:hypothetical protein
MPAPGSKTSGRTGSGRELNRKWSIGAQHVLYRVDGKWFHVLERFPGALCDANGYVLFSDKADYLNSPYLRVGVRTHVPNGINQMPNYVRMVGD